MDRPDVAWHVAARCDCPASRLAALSLTRATAAAHAGERARVARRARFDAARAALAPVLAAARGRTVDTTIEGVRQAQRATVSADGLGVYCRTVQQEQDGATHEEEAIVRGVQRIWHVCSIAQPGIVCVSVRAAVVTVYVDGKLFYRVRDRGGYMCSMHEDDFVRCQLAVVVAGRGGWTAWPLELLPGQGAAVGANTAK